MSATTSTTTSSRPTAEAPGSALTVQARVILALILREIHTLHGDSRLGYLWAVIQTAFGIAVFWAVREYTHSRPPHGLTTLSFLAIGFMIFRIFSSTLTKCMAAAKGNRALLRFPQVFPLDIMLARCIVLTATQIVSTAAILGIGMVLGYPAHIADVGLILLAVFLAMTFGLGCGIIFATLSYYVPALEKIVSMFLIRAMFFASGVFFSVAAFSNRVGSWLLLNPVMQFIEMARTALSDGYASPYYDLEYLLTVNLGVLAAGLLLERFIRRRLQV